MFTMMYGVILFVFFSIFPIGPDWSRSVQSFTKSHKMCSNWYKNLSHPHTTSPGYTVRAIFYVFCNVPFLLRIIDRFLLIQLINVCNLLQILHKYTTSGVGASVISKNAECLVGLCVSLPCIITLFALFIVHMFDTHLFDLFVCMYYAVQLNLQIPNGMQDTKKTVEI